MCSDQKFSPDDLEAVDKFWLFVGKTKSSIIIIIIIIIFYFVAKCKACGNSWPWMEPEPQQGQW